MDIIRLCGADPIWDNPELVHGFFCVEFRSARDDSERNLLIGTPWRDTK